MIDASSFARFGLMLVRPSLLVMGTPVLGGAYVPPMVRVGLSVLLALAVGPMVPAPSQFGELGLVVVTAQEAVIGLALAMGVRALVAGAELAGHLAGFQIGLSYAAVVDPQSGVRNNVVAAIYSNVAVLTFLGIDGHHSIIRALADSYTSLPIGAATFSGPIGAAVSEMLGLVFLTGIRLAAPVVSALLLIELALGLVSRSAPALNLMVIAPPLRLMLGLILLAAGMQVIPGVVIGTVRPALEAGLRLTHALR